MKPTTEFNQKTIEEYEALHAEIDRLKKREAELGTIIKGALKPGSYASGDYTIDLIVKRGALDKKVFQRDFPVGDFPEMYTQVPSTDAILEVLGDDGREYFGTVLALTIKKVRAVKKQKVQE